MNPEELYAIYAPMFEDPSPHDYLEKVVRHLLDEGYERQVLIDTLIQYGLQLRAQGKDQEEDTIHDLLDRLTGWCPPDLKI